MVLISTYSLAEGQFLCCIRGRTKLNVLGDGLELEMFSLKRMYYNSKFA